MIKERRKHPRLRIPLEAEYLVAGRQEWREGTIWTLGAGGAALLCEERLEKGTQLDGLHFIVEKQGDLPETRIEVGAEVVSLERKSDFGRPSNFMLGLRFTDLGEQEFELLRQFVFRRLTGHKNGKRGGEEEDQGKEGPPPIEIRFKLFDEFVEEVSENLSPSGMFIRAHRPLPPGSRFVFQFQLGDDFSLFQGTAEVVWTRRRAEGPDRPPGMGVRFLKLDLTSQKMVRRLVHQRQDEADSGAGGRGDAEETAATPPLRLSEQTEPFAIAGEPPPEADREREARERASADRQAELELRLTRLEEQLAEAKAARDDALEQATRVEDEADALRQENQALEASRDEAQEAQGRAETEAADLLAELETLRPDSGAEERLRQSSDELERDRETWQALEAELREDLERQRAVEAELRDALAEAGRTEERLREGLEEAGEATADLQQQVQRGNETEAELRQRLEQATDTEAELRQRLEGIAATEAELRRSLERAEEAEIELHQRIERAEAGSEELEKQTERAAAAEVDLERQRQEAADARREWDALEAELRSQLEARSAAEAELEERLTEATGVEAELRQRLSELRGSRDELERRLAQGAEIEAALREQAQELRASRDALQTEQGRTRRQLARIRAAAEEMRSRFNGDLSAALALESELSSRLAQVAEVGTSLEEKVAGLTKARADLAERLARITGAWSGLEEGLVEVVAEPDEADGATERGSEVAADVETAPPVEEDVAAPAAAAPMTAEQTAEPAPVPEAATATGLEPTAVELAEEPVVEPVHEEPPAPKEKGGLVGAARRAVARLGFGRRTAADDEETVDDAASLLEARTEPVVEEDADGPAEIEETVRAWAAAWSEQRVEDYLSFYSREFESARPEAAGDSDHAPHAWLPPLDGMELTLGPISQTELAPGRFAVRFEQSVESDSYTRRTGRTLEMVREADAWKIAAESFQEL